MMDNEGSLNSSGELQLSRETAVELINAAKLSEREDKQNLLAQVFEFAFNKERNLLSEFLPYILEFELDKTAVIRKFVVGCIESVCKVLPEYIAQCIEPLSRFVSDSSPVVSKRAILCGTNIWRSCLDFLCSGGPQATPLQTRAWTGLTDLKSRILKVMDGDNDSAKPHGLKFIETLVLTFSSIGPSVGNGVEQKRNKGDTFSLDNIPQGHTLLLPPALRREGEAHLQLIIEQLKKPDQSSTTLTAIITTLNTIARHRPGFIITIATALIQAQQQPSPSVSSLTPSQQQNVNHTLRLALFSILRLRNPDLKPWVVSIVESLSALGAKDQVEEATKYYGDLDKLPQPLSGIKRPISPDSPVEDSKRQKKEDAGSNSNSPPQRGQFPPKSGGPPSLPAPAPAPQHTSAAPADGAVGLNSNDHLSLLSLLSQLPTELVVKLIFENMEGAPMPAPGSSNTSGESDIMRSLQSQSQPVAPAPAPPAASRPADPRVREAPRDPRKRAPPAEPAPSQTSMPTISTPNSPPAPISTPQSPTQNSPPPIPGVQPPIMTSQLPGILSNGTSLPFGMPPNFTPPGFSQPTRPMPGLNPQFQPPSNLIPSPTQPTPAPLLPHVPLQPLPQSIPPQSSQFNQPSQPQFTQPPQPTPVSQPQSLLPPQPQPPPVQPPPPKPQIPKAPVLPIPSFNETQLRQLADASFARLMGSEEGAAKGGKRALWVALMSRLAGTLPLDGEMAQKLITHIVTNFVTRKELALTWICHEFIASPGVRYPQLLLGMLRTLRERDPTSRAFNSLIVEVPQLPEAVWDIMTEYSTSPDRVTLGLSTLRDLVVWRPPVRERGLALLLDYTHHEDDIVRSPAVRLVANQLYPIASLTQTVLEFATQMLSTLAAPPPPQEDAEMKEAPQEDTPVTVKTEPMDEDKKAEEKTGEEKKEEGGDVKKEGENAEDGEKKEESKSGLTESEIQRKLFLYIALCTKRHDLLSGLLEVYMAAPSDVRKVIHQQMPVLIKAMGQGSPHMLQLIAQCPKGGESFAMQCLRTLTEAGRPSNGLVSAAKSAYKRLGDVRLLIPVLSGMEKDEVVAMLPRLLVLPPATTKSIVQHLAAGPAPLSQADLLVALHQVDGVPLRRVLEATQYCLEMPSVFKQDVMAVVLNQLSSSTQVPPLFMRTMLQTIQKFPKLTGYTTELLLNLIPKQVWMDKRLWEGFVRCCHISKPHSFKVLLKLPAPQVEDILKTYPDIKEPLAKAAKQDKKSIPKATLKVLGFDEPVTEEREREREREREG